MAEITGVDVAAHEYIRDTLINVNFTKPNFVGLLFGLDTFYNQKVGRDGESSGRFRPVGIKGGKMAVNYRVSEPSWEGFDGLSPDPNDAFMSPGGATEDIQGKMGPSNYRYRETINKAKLAAIEGDAPFRNYIKSLVQSGMNGWMTKVDADLFPTNPYQQDAANDHIMSFFYSLQSGYVGNQNSGVGISGGTSFNYLGIDLNARPELKALQVGTDSTPFVVSWANFEEQVLGPLRDRGANVDLVLVDSAIYTSLKAQLGTNVRQIQKDGMPLRAMPAYFQLDDGTFVVREKGLDRFYQATGKRHMAAGDSQWLRFGMNGSEVKKNIKVIEDVPLAPSIHLLQGFMQAQFVNEAPRFWAHIYNADTPD